MKKLALIILDGFGINNNSLEENSIYLGNNINFKNLFNNLYTSLHASGKMVGLPDGQMGNSEVGHMTLGAGRIFKQSLVKIDDMFEDGTFQTNKIFQNIITHINNYEGALHLMSLFGNGGVHASQNHLENILKIIPQNIKVYLHLFSDGRDLPPKSLIDILPGFISNLTPNIRIATISGRYYSMDRDNNWDRIKLAYDVIVSGTNKIKISELEFIEKSYLDGVYDEFISPTSFGNYNGIGEDDAVLFMNFRSDRAKQLTKVFTDEKFNRFSTKDFDNMYFVTMTKYFSDYDGDYIVGDDSLENILPEVISKVGYSQLHLAETEKFAHVTKFFNGGNQIIYENEVDILVPSHKVDTYDLDPEMSAQEIYDNFENNAKHYDFSIVNFANGDMVGHTGNLNASIKSIEKLDNIIGNIINFCKLNNIELIITADHGNCEEMGTIENPKTSHSTNLVPLWYISGGNIIKTKLEGSLADVAPTILDIMGIKIPNEMTGNSLLE